MYQNCYAGMQLDVSSEHRTAAAFRPGAADSFSAIMLVILPRQRDRYRPVVCML